MFKSEDYINSEVIIRSTGVVGTIKEVLRRRGQGGGLAVRFLVIDAAGKQHELMPHEINKNYDNQTNPTIQPDAVRVETNQ